jgi:hypothetical protein
LGSLRTAGEAATVKDELITLYTIEIVCQTYFREVSNVRTGGLNSINSIQDETLSTDQWDMRRFRRAELPVRCENISLEDAESTYRISGLSAG